MARPELLKAAILSTMSMFAVPLEASAETCQPANSFANMPLFIAVALIGAAVGGKTLNMLIGITHNFVLPVNGQGGVC
jgi:hypothetical protein